MCVLLIVMGVITVIITDCISLLGNFKHVPLFVDVESLANDESYERWDGMELVTYRCEDGHRSGKACELSSGNPSCDSSEEEFCTEEGDNRPDPNKCPAGGYHEWKLYFVKGEPIVKCSKCNMNRE